MHPTTIRMTSTEIFDISALSTLPNKKVQSIEVFVQISCIAFGILQLLAVQEATEGDLSTLFYTRTKSKSRVSEARVRWYMGWQINHLLLQHPDSFITKFIRERQMK